ncbi:DUF6120 family protein [Ruminococcus flavefaciens]|jgi:hypothetical protein|uniref:DUF6120 family protein n=1 Tax=Ruminococcus flavefaciens TaxID=1265 RepID=UPI0015651F0A|nr:DUF6120 family protein [Ruminococcus flavefaciens]
MKITSKERRKYLKDISRLLVCDSTERKKFLRDLNENIDEYLASEPEASIEDLYRNMGTPREIADGFLSNADPRTIRHRLSIVRIIIVAVAAIVVLLGVTLFSLWLDTHESHEDYFGEITITEYSEVSGTTVIVDQRSTIVYTD